MKNRKNPRISPQNDAHMSKYTTLLRPCRSESCPSDEDTGKRWCIAQSHQAKNVIAAKILLAIYTPVRSLRTVIRIPSGFTVQRFFLSFATDRIQPQWHNVTLIFQIVEKLPSCQTAAKAVVAISKAADLLYLR